LGSCKDKALDLVARRPHFQRELRHKLLDRGFAIEEVDSALEDVARLGLLDDPGAARDLAAGPMTRKGFGPRRMRMELLRRGVDETTVETVLAELFEEAEEEYRRAREAASRQGIGKTVDRDRLARHLDRKGYSKAVILQVLRDLEGD